MPNPVFICVHPQLEIRTDLSSLSVMHAIRIHETGGPEKLRLEEVPLPEPGPGQVRLRVEAAGLNYVDTYHRTGLYPQTLPFTPGLEAAGVITAVGRDAGDFRVGDRVATARATGAYADEALAPVAQLVRVPDGVAGETAAAVLLQGLTAHALACDVFPLKAGDVALVHSAAGGVGLLLTQIARHRGARVIACVSTDAKAALAREAGAGDAIVTSRENFTEGARRLTDGRGVDVVYDAVGKDTFEGSLNSLRPRGMMVSYGNASGPVAPFSPLLLTQKGSLFFTRPSFGHYAATPAELRARAEELFRWVADGALKVWIGSRFPLGGAAEAHRAIESRATTGKVLLLP
ncbi:MAG TPA: quinone oxidoreductase [Opitutus sp.]|nr:quinone oxidoreductase [Opitutus sp.]